jgi:hypothetical protein
MNKAIILLFLILVTAISLSSINHMDELFWISGDQAYGDYGAGLAALDFNGDGYDDIAVLQNCWVPDSLISQLPYARYGKLLFYYGGPDFDSTPDFTIQGTYNGHLAQNQYSAYIVNLGDVNGDGYDDLGTRGFTEGTSATTRPYIAVYFGGQNPSNQPGYYQSFTSPHSGGTVEIDPVGDINNDGFDDFSYSYRPESTYEELSRAAIILGGSMQEIIWRQFTNDDLVMFSKVGDVNNDLYDDYIVSYHRRLEVGYNTSNTIYYGNCNVLPLDSLEVYSGQGVITWRTRFLGDLNGDSVDDFTGIIANTGMYVWYGNYNITAQYDLILTPRCAGTSNLDRGLVYGDLNNDGYDDVIGSLPAEYGETGSFRIWLGGTNMNGTSDLLIAGHLSGMQFGTGMAAGDFNGDGFCDVAASEPHSQTFDSTPGRLYVYAGNAELADTTVSNDDSVIPDVNTWSFGIVPNPVPGGQNWKIKFSGSGYEKYTNLKVIICNIKGQKLRSISLNVSQLRSGEVSLPGLNLPKGIYEVSLFDRSTIVKSTKVTIR